MTCPKCGSEIWDNRSDKANGVKTAKWPDFKCKDKACDWAQWPDKPKPNTALRPRIEEPEPLTVRPKALGAEPRMPWEPDERDAAICALFWNSVDAVLLGVKERKLTDFFHPENLCSLIATLYIQRSKR